MKIGFVSAHVFSYPGGVQKHILALKNEFEKRGHEVKLIMPRDTLSSSNLLLKARGKNRYSFKEDKETIFFGGALYIPGNASRTNLSLNITPLSIWRRLKKEKFDILHFQNFGAFLPIQILEAASQLSKPPLKILTLHALWDASLILREIPAIPTLIDVFKDYLLPRFDGIIGTSKPVLSQIEYKGLKEIIPNGIDLIFFNPGGKKIEKFINNQPACQRLKPQALAGRQPTTNNQQPIDILFIGRIEKRKGLIYLLKAFEALKQRHEKLRLIVVGEGERRKKMKDFVKNHKISDVFFEGEVKEEDLPKYYRTADICCFPSIYGEGFGIVLLEAMASGKPVVAFANQGYKGVLKDKGSAFLVEPKDVNGLVEKLEILIKSKNKREEMGEWGQEEAKKYSWDEIADKTLKFYNKTIQYKT